MQNKRENKKQKQLSKGLLLQLGLDSKKWTLKSEWMIGNDNKKAYFVYKLVTDKNS